MPHNSHTLILENDDLRMVYYPDTKIVHHTFLRPAHGAAFHVFLDAGVDTLRKYRAQKWLSDDRMNTAYSSPEIHWCFADWLQRAVDAGWHYWALVLPEDIYAKLNMNEFVQEFLQAGIQIRIFTDVEPARTWLEEM